ncbi:MAG: hypothetical protein Kow0069_11640 [Promethearchaeota archaeon]
MKKRNDGRIVNANLLDAIVGSAKLGTMMWRPTGGACGWVLFTLVGPAVDSLVERLLELRVADQKAAADEAVRSVFTAVFPPETRPLFNLMLHISKTIDVKKFAEVYAKGVPPDVLEEMLEAPDSPHVKREIDGALLVFASLPVEFSPSTSASGSASGDAAPVPPAYTLIEVKLFTSPPEEPARVVERRLRRSELESYFQVRHVFGLLGFSYLHEEGVEEPVARSDPRLQGAEELHLWAAHLALFVRRVLDDYPDAKTRARAVLGAIAAHQSELGVATGGVNYKFSLTPNLIKVIHMSSTIAELRGQLSRLKEEVRRAEEEKRRAEEEKRRAEEEKRRAEERLESLQREAEAYKRKLEEHGLLDE